MGSNPLAEPPYDVSPGHTVLLGVDYQQGFGDGEFHVEAYLQQVTQFIRSILLADFLVLLFAVEEGESVREGERPADQRGLVEAGVLVEQGAQVGAGDVLLNHVIQAAGREGVIEPRAELVAAEATHHVALLAHHVLDLGAFAGEAGREVFLHEADAALVVHGPVGDGKGAAASI